MIQRPRVALVSTSIRRDLLAPLRNWSDSDLVHFYRRIEYGDLSPEDLDSTLRKYHSPFDLFRKLRQERASVIQTVEPFSIAQQPFFWACYLAARQSGARICVVTFENRSLELKFNRPLAWLLRQSVRPIIARACLLVAVNHGALNNLLLCGIPSDRIKEMMWGTWGVDVEEFSPPAAPTACHTILFAGRLHPEKGIFVLLDAFARIYAKEPRARLHLVGDGPARSEVCARIRDLNLETAVKLFGVIKNRAMPDQFRASRVLVAPSVTTPKWAEQVGMSAIQAMACGVPVVATTSGSIPEYIPDGVAGILIKENDVDALADAVLQVLRDNSLHARLSRGAREYALEHYDARINVQRAQNALEEHCLARRV